MTVALKTPLQFVALDSLVEAPWNPRKRFDEAALKELADSIRAHGILQPLVVRQTQNGKLEIVAGARRFRAAKIAKLEQLPVIVRDIEDYVAIEMAVIENQQREDVHPLEECAGYKELLRAGRYDVETLASKVGKSVSYVYQRLKLADLIPEAQEAFLKGDITAGHAVLIARLSEEQQRDALDWCSDCSVPRSVRDFSKWIKARLYILMARAPWDVADEQLVPAAGSCTRCPKRTGSNLNLFGDIAEEDHCMDRSCWETKLAAHIERRRSELAAQGKEVHLIAESRTKGCLSRSQFREAYSSLPEVKPPAGLDDAELEAWQWGVTDAELQHRIEESQLLKSIEADFGAKLTKEQEQRVAALYKEAWNTALQAFAEHEEREIAAAKTVGIWVDGPAAARSIPIKLFKPVKPIEKKVDWEEQRRRDKKKTAKERKVRALMMAALRATPVELTPEIAEAVAKMLMDAVGVPPNKRPRTPASAMLVAMAYRDVNRGFAQPKNLLLALRLAGLDPKRVRQSAQKAVQSETEANPKPKPAKAKKRMVKKKGRAAAKPPTW